MSRRTVVRIAPTSCVPLVRIAPLVALLAFVAELSLRPMAESDLFFRIKAGQEILARHGLPGRNLFSFTSPDYPDVDAAWLFEVGRGGAARARRVSGGRDREDGGAARGVRGARSGSAAGAAPGRSPRALALGRRGVRRPRALRRAPARLLARWAPSACSLAIDALVGRAGKRRRARGGAGAARGVALWANLHAGVFVAPVAAGAAPRRARGSIATARRGGRLARWRRWRGARDVRHAARLRPLRYLRLHLMLPALHPVDEFRAPSWLSDAGALRLRRARFVAAGALGWRRLRWTRGAAGARGRAARACARSASAPTSRSSAAPLLAVGLTRWPAIALAGPLAAPRLGRCPRRWAWRPCCAGAAPAARASAVARRRHRPRHARAAARPRSRSSTRTACAIACTTTSRSARTCCSNRPAAIRATACSSTRGCRPIPPSSTGCWAAPT